MLFRNLTHALLTSEHASPLITRIYIPAGKQESRGARMPCRTPDSAHEKVRFGPKPHKVGAYKGNNTFQLTCALLSDVVPLRKTEPTRRGCVQFLRHGEEALPCRGTAGGSGLTGRRTGPYDTAFGGGPVFSLGNRGLQVRALSSLVFILRFTRQRGERLWKVLEPRPCSS